MENETVDARGLSCPQPVLLTKRAMAREGSGTLVVLVDSATSRDNVARLATKQGWAARSEQAPDGTYTLHLNK